MAQSLLPSRSSLASPVNAASVPAHLMCNACAGLLINCMQTEHGLRLCQPCANSKLHPTIPSLCPGSDPEDLSSESMASQATCWPDTATRREVSNVSVHCINSEAGCQVQLTLKHLESHLSGACEHEFALCVRCSQQIVRHKLLSSHRNLQSDECCPKFWAACPLCGNSSRSLNPAAFAAHRETCPAVQTDCKYACSGCQERMQRSHLTEHYRLCTDEHLALTVRQLQLENERKDRKIAEMEARLDVVVKANKSQKGLNKSFIEGLEQMKIGMHGLEKRNQELSEQIRTLQNESNQHRVEQAPGQTDGPPCSAAVRPGCGSAIIIDKASAMRSIAPVSNRVSNQPAVCELCRTEPIRDHAKVRLGGHRRSFSSGPLMIMWSDPVRSRELESIGDELEVDEHQDATRRSGRGSLTLFSTTDIRDNQV